MYGYEKNEIRRKDSTDSPFDKIPDLPPMNDNFPNLFSRLPSKYGEGFFGGFDDNFSMKPVAGKVERVVPTTYKPVYTTTKAPYYHKPQTTPKYFSRTPTTPKYYERSPTTPKYYNRSPTTPKYYDRTPNSYDRYSEDKKPSVEKTKAVDIKISNSGSSGLAVTPRPPRLHSPSPYPFYTPRAKTPTTAPYEFYRPTTPVSRLDQAQIDNQSPDSLPPPENFPSFHKTPHGPYQGHKRPTPLQSLLNPLRNMFSFGANRHPNHPPMRRHYNNNNRPYGLDQVDAVPEPLPPPAGFPDFKYSSDEEMKEYDNGFDIDNRRRRRKRPRRPLFDDKIKESSNSNNFQDLMTSKKSLYGEPSRRPALYRKRPLHRTRYMDMDYSPSDKEEILTTALTTQPMKTTVRVKQQASSEVGVFNPGN